MKRDQIEELLDKYWRCETTVAEEQLLRSCFMETDLPDEYRCFVPLFAYLEEEQSPRLSRDFDRRLQEALRHAPTPLLQKRSARLAALMRIAASFLLIGGIGISLFFITRQNNHPQYAVGNEETSEAMEQAAFALEKLSDALLMSEKASLETIRQIDEMKIDWELIDSLSKEDPQQEGNSLKEMEDTGTRKKSEGQQQEGAEAGYRKPLKREARI